MDNTSAYFYSSIVWILSVCFKVLLQASNLYTVAAFGPDAHTLILYVPNEHKYRHIYRLEFNNHIDEFDIQVTVRRD